jgi:spectinomycin phosphotransferase
VHAPIAQPNGDVLVRLGDYAAAVFPFIEGISDASPAGARHRMLAALGRLHTATPAVPADLAQRDTLRVPLLPRLLLWLDDLDSPWTHGPYGEPTRRLLQQKVRPIRDLIDHCEKLADAVHAGATPWVVTHGQMHVGNVVWTTRDELLFVDWDCAAVAPRERDLGAWGNNLDPKTEEDWAAYRVTDEPCNIDPTTVDLYRYVALLWTICADTEVFRSPHVDNADARHEWNNLQRALTEIDR